jgi:predicted DNA-binding ribbon-helix-helix protein
MVKRRNLKGKDTTWMSIKLPTTLYEELRTKAFQQKVSLSLLITEILQQHNQKEALNDNSRT